jgi:DNA polymerase-2
VQAARKLDKPGRWVRYVITSGGPEPVRDHIPKPDYQHYRERQLAPAANGILHFLDTSFESITDAQLEFF